MIRGLGGAVCCNSFTKFYLALLGQYPYRNCASVPPDRHGLSESIEGRLARAGGRATVTSAPGEGTEVELRLP